MCIFALLFVSLLIVGCASNGYNPHYIISDTEENKEEVAHQKEQEQERPPL